MAKEPIQKVLEKVLGSRYVYFQPPSGTKLTYPCIVYGLADIRTTKADNIKYTKNYRYTVTLIHTRPDNTIKDDILDLPMCSLDRVMKSDNLYHYYYDLFY